MSATTTTTVQPTLSLAVTEQAQYDAGESIEDKILEEISSITSSTKTTCCQKPYYDVSLNYRLDPDKGGDEIIWGGTYGQMRRKYEKTPVRIYDERGHESNFKLDVHGFQLVKNKAENIVIVDGAVPHKGSAYDEECESLMKEM